MNGHKCVAYFGLCLCLFALFVPFSQAGDFNLVLSPPFVGAGFGFSGSRFHRNNNFNAGFRAGLAASQGNRFHSNGNFNAGFQAGLRASRGCR